MTKDTMKEAAVAAENLLFDDWVDAIEDGVRSRVRGFIETMLEEELAGVLSRPRYGRRKPSDRDGQPPVVGCRHGHRKRTLTGTFGKTQISVPRARLVCEGEDGKTREWKSRSLRAYQRRTKAADALIAGAYLSGTNTRRVRRALQSVFAGAVGKDVVSRTWRKVKGDWDAWTPARSPMSQSSGSFSTEPSCACGSTRRPRRSRCSSRSACAPTVKKCCSRSRTWAAKAKPPGARCSTISSNAA